MPTEFINIKRLTRDMVRIEQTLARVEDIATTRALNIVVGQGRNELVDEVVNEYGYPKNSIKRRVNLIKATRKNKTAGYHMKSTRLGYAKPKKLKSGVSFIKKGGSRTKLTTKVKAGSRPFLVNATAGKYGKDIIEVSGTAKKAAVYRKPGFKRKTTTLLGPSVRKMVKTVGIDEKWLFRYIEKNLPNEYSKQLKKANFRGRF